MKSFGFNFNRVVRTHLKQQCARPAGFVLAGLFTCVAIQTPANAQLTLSYEEAGGGHAIGDPFTGAFKLNFGDFDMGSLYRPIAVGSSIGFGAGGTGTQTIPGGISTLDNAQTSGATNAFPTQTTVNGVAQGAGSIGPEDSWGIARISQITDLSNRVVWSEAGKNSQLTVIFYGEKDFYANQFNADSQEINGVGLHADFYLQSKSASDYTAFNPDLGSAGRTSLTMYNTVTDGFKILTTVSTNGFIHDAGTAGGLATEFSSRFNPNSGGDGQAYLSVTGGTDAARFDTNGFNYAAGYGFIPGNTADLFAQFTTHASPGVADWLVSSDDPVRGAFAAVAVPEPSTYGLVGAALLVGMTAIRRRLQKKVRV